MKCKQCGAEIKNDEKFCRICGARLPAAAAESGDTPKPEIRKPEPQKPSEPAAKQDAKPKKEKKPFKLPKKAIVIATIVAVAVIVAVIAVLLFGGGGSSELSLDPNRPFVIEYYDRAVVYAADGTVLASVEGYAEVQESVWNSTIAIRQGDISESPYGGAVTVVANGAVTTIDKTVCGIVVSADGSHIAYIERAGGMGDGDLYVYEVESGESRFIDSDVILDTVVLSPDGTRLAYNIFDMASDAEHTLVGKSTGEGERLLDCERMYALSNDGIYTYFFNNAKFYVEKDGERTRLSESTETLYHLYTNSAGNEAFISADFGCRYYKDGVLIMLTDDPGLNGFAGFTDEMDRTMAEVIRVASFADTVLISGDGLIDVSGETPKNLAARIAPSHAVMSESSKRLAYINFDGVICVSDGDASASDFKQIAPDERPTFICADPKLSNIYFANARGELWRLNGDKTTMVSADASNFCMSGSGTLYFLYDGVVLCRADGSERVSLGRMDNFLDIESIFGDIARLNPLGSTPQGIIVKPVSGEATYFRDDSTEGITLPTTVTTPTEVE